MTQVTLAHLNKTLSLECHPADYLTEHLEASKTFYELPLLETLRRNFPTQKTVVDVGANIGNHALFFAEFFALERLICFEPYGPNFVLLEKNLAGKAELHRVALGDTNGSCALKIYPGNSGMTEVDTSSVGNFEMRTLDSYNLTDVTLLKIDVENFYLQTLKGAMETIRRCSPIIIFEADFYDVFPVLQAEGYVCAAYWRFDTRSFLFLRTGKKN